MNAVRQGTAACRKSRAECLVALTQLCFHLQSSYGYGDLFSDTWKAFTDHDVIHLKAYDSKRVLAAFRARL